MKENDLALRESRPEIVLPGLADIPDGEFRMGCEVGRDDEKPVHRVWVEAFSMGVTAVTNEQYLQFVEQSKWSMPPSLAEERYRHPQQPVVAVTWFDAMRYCRWLTSRTEQLFRLPTEAEWEYAIRAGREGGLYAWGNTSPQSFELYRTGWRDERPHVVGLYPPNAYGLYDLGDNVHEWCLDWYDPGYYEKSQYPRNPVNLIPGTRRSSRGGSWRHRIKVSRCAARSSLGPGLGYTDYGFRIVRTKRDFLGTLDGENETQGLQA
jgi:formylglycine-generating enzyme required for sulfatase activity